MFKRTFRRITNEIDETIKSALSEYNGNASLCLENCVLMHLPIYQKQQKKQNEV